MIALLTVPDALAALAALTALEIVLDVDNIVFNSILISRCTRKEAPNRKFDLNQSISLERPD